MSFRLLAALRRPLRLAATARSAAGRAVPLALRGARRIGSLYLLSAGLVLFGARGGLLGRSAAPSAVDLAWAGAAYQVAILLALAYLYRVRRRTDEIRKLVLILSAFMLDGLLTQPKLGWTDATGQMAAALGFAGDVLVAVAAAAILDLPLVGSLLGTLLAGVAFLRFGPMLLAGSREPYFGVVPSYVALGWLVALVLLPALLLPRMDRRANGPALPAMDGPVVALTLAILLVHFRLAGANFGLSFRLAYLGPLLVLLRPTLERFGAAPAAGGRAWRILLAHLPYLGLALSAAELTPGLLDTHWAQAWPLTPFCLTLVLTLLVEGLRAHHSGQNGPWYATSGLLCLALLGGDLPELLAQARFPATWQLLGVMVIAWTTMIRIPSFRLGLLFQIIPSFVLASWIAEWGYPWLVAVVLALAWSVLALEAITGETLAPKRRALVVATVTLLAVVILLADHSSTLRFGLGALQCVVAFLAGRWRDDRLLHRFAVAATIVGIAGYAVVLPDYDPTRLGETTIELGFAVLVLAVLNSLFGEQVRRSVEHWWRSLPEARR